METTITKLTNAVSNAGGNSAEIKVTDDGKITKRVLVEGTGPQPEIG